MFVFWYSEKERKKLDRGVWLSLREVESKTRKTISEICFSVFLMFIFWFDKLTGIV